MRHASRVPRRSRSASAWRVTPSQSIEAGRVVERSDRGVPGVHARERRDHAGGEVVERSEGPKAAPLPRQLVGAVLEVVLDAVHQLADGGGVLLGDGGDVARSSVRAAPGRDEPLRCVKGVKVGAPSLRPDRDISDTAAAASRARVGPLPPDPVGSGRLRWEWRSGEPGAGCRPRRGRRTPRRRSADLGARRQ